MISIDRQPWEHRGGPAFVTSKLNPIADPQRTLMNCPCSPSLFNWWHVPFQVDHHYVPCIHWFSKTPPPFLWLLFLAFLRNLTEQYKPIPTFTSSQQEEGPFNLHFILHSTHMLKCLCSWSTGTIGTKIPNFTNPVLSLQNGCYWHPCFSSFILSQTYM